MRAGERLGPYEFLAPIGAGGMGEVFRARDTRLDRDVAIKVLPEDLFENDERKRRFEREAKLLASVNHPNIAAIHSFEEISGRCLLVQELLAGGPLRVALAEGPLPVRRALDVVIQIAEALAAAHENGIVHRDVKPENVFLGPDGRVKLIDFGLARNDGPRRDPGDTRSPTVTDLSRPGGVVGTVSYMSPEQAKGQSADYRSDQFSLGIVLYEMLAGRRPFRRDSAAETLTAIIREEPEPLAKVAPGVPGPVRWIVERCLAKEPEGRFDATRDLAKDLADCRAHLSEMSNAGVTAAASLPRRAFARWGPWALAGAATAVAIAIVLGGQKAASRVRFDLDTPPGTQLQATGHAIDLSPDGRRMVISAFSWKKPYLEPGEPQLFLRPLDSFEATPLPGTESGTEPTFSPDGRWIAFAAASSGKSYLKKSPADGGPPITLCECRAEGGITWMGDGSLVFASHEGGPLRRVPAVGGEPEAVTRLDEASGEVSHLLPHALPDGRTLVYTAISFTHVTWDNARIYAQRLGAATRSLLVEGGSDGRWVAPGLLVFARKGSLLAARVSSSGLSLAEPPTTILEGVAHSVMAGIRSFGTGAAQAAVSADGRLVYAPGSVHPERQRIVVWVDEKGRETPVGLPKQSYLSLNVSPDGSQVLFSRNYAGEQIEVLDLERGTRRRVTFAGNHSYAIWGSGPGKITFVSDHEGPWRLYSRQIDAPPERITSVWRGTGRGVSLGSWSADGKTLAFMAMSEKGDWDIWTLPEGGEARPFLSTQFDEINPEISPDGRWLAYASNESGRHEVLVRSLDGLGPSRQVSVAGGREPVWSRAGSFLHYKQWDASRSAAAIYRVSVSARDHDLRLGRPEKLFEGEYGKAALGRNGDVSPDGRFLLDKMASEDEAKQYFDRIYPHRIRVDLGGVPRLMAEAEKRP